MTFKFTSTHSIVITLCAHHTLASWRQKKRAKICKSCTNICTRCNKANQKNAHPFITNATEYESQVERAREPQQCTVYTDESVMQIKQMLLWGFLLYSLWTQPIFAICFQSCRLRSLRAAPDAAFFCRLFFYFNAFCSEKKSRDSISLNPTLNTLMTRGYVARKLFWLL